MKSSLLKVTALLFHRLELGQYVGISERGTDYGEEGNQQRERRQRGQGMDENEVYDTREDATMKAIAVCANLKQ